MENNNFPKDLNKDNKTGNNIENNENFIKRMNLTSIKRNKNKHWFEPHIKESNYSFDDNPEDIFDNNKKVIKSGRKNDINEKKESSIMGDYLFKNILTNNDIDENKPKIKLFKINIINTKLNKINKDKNDDK